MIQKAISLTKRLQHYWKKTSIRTTKPRGMWLWERILEAMWAMKLGSSFTFTLMKRRTWYSRHIKSICSETADYEGYLWNQRLSAEVIQSMHKSTTNKFWINGFKRFVLITNFVKTKQKEFSILFFLFQILLLIMNRLCILESFEFKNPLNLRPKTSFSIVYFIC